MKKRTLFCLAFLLALAAAALALSAAGAAAPPIPAANELSDVGVLRAQLIQNSNAPDGYVSAQFWNVADAAAQGGLHLIIYQKDGALAHLESKALSLAPGASAFVVFDVKGANYPPTEFTYRLFSWTDALLPLVPAADVKQPENVALHRAAYQSASIDEFYTGTLVSDGIVSETTARRFDDGPWMSVSRYNKEWIYVDLGAATPIEEVTTAWGECYATRYVLQTSDDAVNWTTRVSVGSNVYSGGGSGTANPLGAPAATWANAAKTDAFPTGAASVSARYVRVLCESSSGVDGLYTLRGLSVNGAAMEEYYALDGFDSYWESSASGTQWVYVDLGEDTLLSGARVLWGGNFAAAYEIQTSSDAKSWKTVATDVGAKDAGVYSEFQDTARYVRLLCKETREANYIVKEFEVYGYDYLDYALPPLPAPEEDGTQRLTGGNWKLQRASEVTADGFALSQAGYDDETWLPATVPSTTLASYINAGAAPDPYYDLNNLMISDSYFTTDFWYRDHFEIPAERQGERVTLNFDAINYRADVYFNGHFLPNAIDTRARSIEGGFIRGKFDVTEFVRFGEENYLAVFIQMNDTPWCYTYTSASTVGASSTIGAFIRRYTTLQGLAFGPWPNGGNLGIDNPTFHAAAGWDWMPTIRGRDTGIYRDVYLSYTGGVGFSDPWMKTDLTINEVPGAYTAQPLAVEGTMAQPVGQNGIGLDHIFDGDLETQWQGDPGAANPSFTLTLPEPLTVNTITIHWGEVIPSAAYETQNAKRFKLEVSEDGVTWRNYDAYPAGGTGANVYPAFAGTDAFDGANLVNLVKGPTNPTSGAAIARSLRYLRFTTLEKMTSVNSDQGVLPPKIQEIRFYTQAQSALDNSGIHKYELDDSRAILTFETDVVNHSDAAVRATIRGEILPGGVPFETTVTVPAEETVTVDISDILLQNPQLWWPNTYGDQPLYTARATLFADGAASDTAEFHFGVREFTYPIDANRLTIYCNGTRIVAKGGNWGMDDALQMDTPQRYDDKVRLHAEENMTMIRNWVGQTNSNDFYNACDKYGILVWDDFWLANPYDGPNPKDRAMFMENALDKVRNIRKHPSLAVYCGRNESNPPNDLVQALREYTAAYDGTRYYFNNSAGAPVGSGGGYSLANYLGTGNAQGPKQYFTNVTSNVLRSERGIPNVPSLQSIQKFVAPENQWPISEVWGHHDWTYFMNGPANTYMNALKSYMPKITWTFPNSPGGAQNPDPDSDAVKNYKNSFTPLLTQLAEWYTLEDFANTAQLINYENHKALFQALTVTRANGLLMWMSQSSWPSFMWQTYDYYLDTNGGYFGVKAGNQPTQPVWDPRDNRIVLSNFTPRRYEDVQTTLTIYDLYGKLISTTVYDTPLLDTDAYGVLLDANIAPKFAESPTDMIFIRLVLKDEDGAVLGENTYWHNKTTYLAHGALAGLADSPVTLEAGQAILLENGNTQVTLTLNLPADASVPSVQTRVRTIADATGQDVLPTFYSDNYFTLLPGDRKVITAEWNPRNAQNGSIHFELSGWNVAS